MQSYKYLDTVSESLTLEEKGCVLHNIRQKERYLAPDSCTEIEFSSTEDSCLFLSRQ